MKMKGKHKRWALSVMVAIISALAFTLYLGTGTGSGWISLLSVVVITAGFSLAGNYFMDKHNERLTTRQANEHPVIWNVMMNGVHIGTISDAQYAAIQREVFQDARLVVSQSLNLGRVVLSAIDKSLVATPLVLFWIAIGLAIFSPESYVFMINGLQKADATSIRSAALNLLQLALPMMFVTIAGMAIVGQRFGFKNYYGEATNRMLRQHCNTPVDGDVHLWRVAEDSSPGCVQAENN